VRVAVVGAGITGLSAALFLRRAGHEVVIFERAPRPGGVIGTRHRDGFVLEDGAVAIRGGRPSVAALLDATDLRDRILPASPEARHRYLLRDGRLVGWTRLFSLGGWVRLAAEIAVRPPAVPDDRETVASFFRRRLGAAVADVLLDPLVAGVTGGDPETLDARGIVPAHVDAERRYGSLASWALFGGRRMEPRGSFTFPGGLGVLTGALAAAAGTALRLGQPVERIEPVGNRFRVSADGTSEDVDRVVLTADPETVAALWPGFHPPALPRAPIAAITLGYAPDAIPSGVPGFGWLAHSRERRDVLGCQWVSGVFPAHAPPGHHLLRVMVGGARMPELVDLDDARLADHARTILREVQGITADPMFVDVVRVVPGIPQAPPGWRRFLDQESNLPPGISLAGWCYTGVGVADGIEAAFRTSAP
jgi:oxygen-dependent protoporphyrinogen oxidase